MNFVIAFCVCFFLTLALARPEEDQYPSRWDDLDLGELLSNKKLMEQHIKCMLDLGKCAPDAKEAKDRIVDALETGCSKCTDKQKAGIHQIIEHLIKNDPENWNKLTEKYDPDKIYVTKYEKELSEIKH